MTAIADGRRTATRDQLVEAAVLLFRRQGVSGTGLDEICRRAGVTKGVFAHHFPGGKRELLTAAVEHNASDVRALLACLAERSDGSAPDLVRTLFATYARLFRKHGWAFGCPVAAAVVEAREDEEIVVGAAFASWRAALRDMSPRFTEGVAALVVAAFEGAILQARADRNADVFDQIGESLARLIESASPRQELPA
jgi:TetR/AcrR family transcriptional regulator, lmrAB and yxaGH operons repressor